MVGTYIPMYFMVEDSWASFAASFGEEYADRVMAVMPMWSIILVVAGIFVFAILGGLLGKSASEKTILRKRHRIMEGYPFRHNGQKERNPARSAYEVDFAVDGYYIDVQHQQRRDYEFCKTSVKPNPLCADPVGTPLQNGRQVPAFISRLLCTGTHSADDIKRSAVLCGFGDDIHYDAVCPWYYDGGLAAFLHLSQ